MINTSCVQKKGKLRACKKASIANTKVLETFDNLKRADGKTIRRKNIEEWTVYMCGNVVKVNLEQSRLWGERVTNLKASIN